MMKAFTDMDADGSGKITEDECRRALKDNGICDDDTLQKLFGKCDKDGDGCISIEEFKAEMNRTQCQK